MKGARVKKGMYFAVVLLMLLFSAVPRVLNYQGKLTTTSGEGINDTLLMTFRLYTSATGGEPLWSQTISNVPITRGLFSVELSGFPDSVDFSEQYWLEVEIDGEALSPREKLASAPYSLKSLSVEQALQSISTTANPSARRGHLRLSSGDGVTLTDTGDTITVLFSGAGGGTVPDLDDVLTAGNFAGGKQIKYLAEPTDAQDAATKAYVDNAISSIPTPSLADVLLAGNSAGDTIRIVNLADPVNPHDAATMNYVDTRISSLPGGTGTENYVARWTGSSTLGTGSIFDDGTNVGIGTTSPSARLYVKTTDTTTVPFQVEALVSLSGWRYRKQINIAGSPGAGTNYQVLLKVGESSGATGADFHVEGHSAIFPSGKNDSGDLRFTADDGVTLLDFWVEKVTGTSPNRIAYVWVKVSADLSTNQIVYCYYGNPLATNSSNGDSTFLFFDDFSGSSLNTSKWTLTMDSGSNSIISVHNDILEINSDGPNYGWPLCRITSIQTFNGNMKLEFYYKNFVFEYKWVTYGGFADPSNHNNRGGMEISEFSYLYKRFNLGAYTPGIANDTNWHKIKIWIWGSQLNISYDDLFINTSTPTIPSNLVVILGDMTAETSPPAYAYYDYIFLCKYVSPEPAFSSAGAEETLPPTQQQTVFYIQNKTGNVGIGTTSPTAKLDVAGGIKSTMWKVSTPIPYAGSGYPRSGSFTSGGGTLLIFASGTAYRSSAGTMRVDVRVDGVSRGELRAYTNEASSHKTLNPITIVLTGISAGSHTVELVLLEGNADTNDYSQVTVLELPF